ncbi:MAG: hypothetical protein AAF693_11045 [Bacteroidota bacterium]
MNKTIERNKALLNRKSLNEKLGKSRLGGTIGKDWKFKKASTTLLERIRITTAEDRRKSAYKRAFLFLTLVGLFGLGSWMVFNMKMDRTKTKLVEKDPIELFTTKTYKTGRGSQLKVEYLDKDTRISEVNYKNGMKHQQAESYYPSGEQFRSAAYFYDTLVVDYYFFKNGDTIPNFPKIKDDKVHRLAFRTKDQSTTVSFNYWDGKVIPGSYQEYDLTTGEVRK